MCMKSDQKNKIYLQITSGRGPAECCRVVALVLEKIIHQAKDKGLQTEVLEREPGPLNRTLVSSVVYLEGSGSRELAQEWEGTVLWISKSPYRIHHQRKNWFVGVNLLSVPEQEIRDCRDIVYQTFRASGPGGQHVNKTETAVRAVHTPSGLYVTASDQRSQLQNKKAATERLLVKLAALQTEQTLEHVRETRMNHDNLQRGNPVKIIKEPLV